MASCLHAFPGLGRSGGHLARLDDYGGLSEQDDGSTVRTCLTT